MPTFRLTYFNMRGRAELSRWIFAAAGQDYEDVRIERDRWSQMKKGKRTEWICYNRVDML